MGVTRDDVAELAGVSPATVSYVVNDGPRPVSPATRQKVLRAIEQLDYTPSAIARSLKTNKTHSVGFIVSDILNSWLASIVKSAEDLLLEQRYSLLVCNSNESPERELVWLRMLLLRRRMDGLILLPTGHNREFLMSMVSAGRHLTLIDRQVEGLAADCVLIDNESGAYEAVQHLVSQGHSRIGLLNLPSSVTPGLGRLCGYERALRDAGLAPCPENFREGSFTAEESYLLAGELLDSHPRPTALLVSSNRLAHGMLRQLRERGLRLPDDLALCVFDDVPCYAIWSPSITAVSVDAHQMAERAVQFVVERMNGAYTGEPRTTWVPCRLQIRESTAGVGAGSRASTGS